MNSLVSMQCNKRKLLLSFCPTIAEISLMIFQDKLMNNEYRYQKKNPNNNDPMKNAQSLFLQTDKKSKSRGGIL